MNWRTPGEFAGKRLKMSGTIRTENIENRCRMVCFVQGEKEDEVLDSNDMHDQPITGTTDWKKYEFTINVPKMQRE